MEPPWEIWHLKDPQKNGSTLKNQQAKAVRIRNKKNVGHNSGPTHRKYYSIIVDQFKS